MVSSEFINNLISRHNTFEELSNEILSFKEYVVPRKEINKYNYSLHNLEESKHRNFYLTLLQFIFKDFK